MQRVRKNIFGLCYTSGHFRTRVLFSKRDQADVVIEFGGRTRATSAISSAFHVASKLIRCRDNEYFLRTQRRYEMRVSAISIIFAAF